METPNKNEKPTFERALFLTLLKNNMLLPTSDDQVGQFEDQIGVQQTIPTEFSDPTIFLTEKDNIRDLTLIFEDRLDIYDLKVASDLDENNTEPPSPTQVD